MKKEIEFKTDHVYVVCPRCKELMGVHKDDYDNEGIYLCEDCGQEILQMIDDGRINPVIIK